MDIKDYFIQKCDAVLVDEQPEKKTEIEPCCEEMAALLLISNGTLEGCETIEEWDAAARHPDHVALRKQIMHHQCRDPLTLELIEATKVNPSLHVKFIEALNE